MDFLPGGGSAKKVSLGGRRKEVRSKEALVQQAKRFFGAEGGGEDGAPLVTPRDVTLLAAGLAAGVAIASLVCCGLHSSAAMAAMWLLYFSIVTAAEGSTF